MCDERQKCDGLALFSGGLDSVLSARVLQEQGLKIICLHFISPFFGDAGKIPYWRRTYGLNIVPVDISEEYVAMLRRGPEHGFGSVLNPCVDCKILMIGKAAELMERYGASFVASGEVLGQRPMSQRRDALNIIRRDAGVRQSLLRPLCAKLLEPTEAELNGLVDREKLYAFSGRGRKNQLTLADKLGIKEIPTPAGGCLLTERENARSFWPVLRYSLGGAEPFRLARAGRQFWSIEGDLACWLCVGRNNADNEALHKFASAGDITIKANDFPGPVALLRGFAPGSAEPVALSAEVIADAAALVVSFSGKACKASEADILAGGQGGVMARAHQGEKGLDGPGRLFEVRPSRVTPRRWTEFSWEDVRKELRALKMAVPDLVL